MTTLTKPYGGEANTHQARFVPIFQTSALVPPHIQRKLHFVNHSEVNLGGKFVFIIPIDPDRG